MVRIALHLFNISLPSSPICLQALRIAETNSHSAILSTAEAEDNKTGYVKGGLFTKAGIELPPPGAEIFWHRREKWERPTEGVDPQ